MRGLLFWISTAIVAVAQLATIAKAHVAEESEVRVISNPHSRPEESALGASAACDPGFLLSPHRIIRTPVATQPDTLIEVTERKVLSVPVPVYHFRQPARLSILALPFKLVLVSDIDAVPGSLRAVRVHPSLAADSWFPGYAWSPLVYSGCDVPVHVGWKFSNPSGEFFYALIVDAEDNERAAVRVGVGAFGELIADSLSVGTRAPAWMIDLLTKL